MPDKKRNNEKSTAREHDECEKWKLLCECIWPNNINLEFLYETPNAAELHKNSYDSG